MSNFQKQQPQPQQQKLIIRNIYIKVKFICRCLMEYQINQQALKTKEIKVDSRNTHYQINQTILLPKQYFSKTSKRQKQFRIIVKLLSGKGLSFTVGYIDINQSTISRNNGTFQVKVSQTQDIQARCTFEVRKNIPENLFITPNKQIADINLLSNQNINDTNSSKSKSSKLEMEFQQLREDYYKLKDKFSKYEETNLAQTVQKYAFSQPRRIAYENKKCNKCCEQQRQRNDMLQGRIKELQRQFSHSQQLFNKQKDILKIFQINLKEKSHQYEQLRKRFQEVNKKNEQLYKSNSVLQQQKIQYLMNQLKKEKQKNNIGEYMAHMFEQIYKVVENIFKQRISNITYLANSKQLNKKQLKRQSLTTPTSPIKKLFYSTDFKKCQQAMENCIIQDVSISGGDLQMSQIKSINMNAEIVMKNILKDFQPKVGTMFSQQCMQTVENYCFKIQKIVNHSVQKLFKKIMQLSSYNQAYKKKLNEDKQQYQNNEQSLIDYLQQLEEGLQTQLQIVKEKDTILERDEKIIQTLNEFLLDKQKRIRELQQAYEKLEDEKNQVRAQLHQNNYIYAVKEEQLLKKIYELQTGFQKPESNQTRHEPTRLRIIQRKPTVFSDNYDDQINENYRQLDDIYQNEVVYESPHLGRLKEDNHQILPQRNQFTLYQDSDEVRLRHTMLKNHRLALVNKLREQMANAENAESIYQNDQQHEKEEKVIEEEFLKVLV